MLIALEDFGVLAGLLLRANEGERLALRQRMANETWLSEAVREVAGPSRGSVGTNKGYYYIAKARCQTMARFTAKWLADMKLRRPVSLGGTGKLRRRDLEAELNIHM